MPRQGLDSTRVLQAAVELADERGLQQLSIVALAERLGVRPPSLYNHIAGRRELLRLIKLRGLNELGDLIAGSAAGLSGGAALAATAHAYRAYAHAHPGIYAATLAAADEHDAELRAAAERLLELLAAILRHWQLQGDATIDAVRVMRSALHGFVVLEQGGGFAMPRDRDASFQALIEILTAGLQRL